MLFLRDWYPWYASFVTGKYAVVALKLERLHDYLQFSSSGCFMSKKGKISYRQDTQLF